MASLSTMPHYRSTAAALFFGTFLLLLSLVTANPVNGLGLATTGGAFSAALQRNHAYKPDGPRDYARARSKWAAKVTSTSNKGNIGGVDAYNTTNDKEYVCPVSVGTPPQQLKLDLDTGSSDLWVMTPWTTSAVDAEIGNRSTYNYNLSSTAQHVNNTWYIQYGDGSYASGSVFKDTVHLGPIVINDVPVEGALFTDESMLQDQDMEGIVGLAYNMASEVTPPLPSFLSLLGPTLTSELFTVDLKWRDVGDYTFGQIDHNRHTGDIHYTPLVPNATLWEVIFDGFHIGNNNYWKIFQWHAIVDTGTSMMLLDEGIVRDYYNSTPGAFKNETMDDFWLFPCDVKLPDFGVGFPNGHHVTIPSKYMVYSDMSDYGMPGLCSGGLQTSPVGFGILGDIFLKATFAVFDMAGSQFGFADKNLV